MNTENKENVKIEERPIYFYVCRMHDCAVPLRKPPHYKNNLFLVTNEGTAAVAAHRATARSCLRLRFYGHFTFKSGIYEELAGREADINPAICDTAMLCIN